MSNLLPKNKELAEKILKAIAQRGKWLGGTVYLLDGQDKYILTGNQQKQLEEIINGRNS